MTFLRSLDRTLTRVEYFFLVLFLGAMVALAFSQVVLRNFFDTGFIWADTLIRHLVLWAGFTGAAIATSEERHIGIEALLKFLPARIVHLARALTSLFAIVACAILVDASLTFLLDEKNAGTELVLAIQTWQAILIIPIGYALIGVHFAVKGMEHLLKGIRNSGGRA